MDFALNLEATLNSEDPIDRFRVMGDCVHGHLIDGKDLIDISHASIPSPIPSGFSICLLVGYCPHGNHHQTSSIGHSKSSF